VLSIEDRSLQISWCACKDDQTSADTTEAGEAVGAMSYVRDIYFTYSFRDID
jgi:hypothetical protein